MGWHLPLLFVTTKHFIVGVRTKIGGKAQMFRSASVVKCFGTGVFKRTGKARFPIEQMLGPSLPTEMLRGAELGGRQPGTAPP